MLKTTPAVGSAASIELGDEEQDIKGIQVDRDKIELAQPP